MDLMLKKESQEVSHEVNDWLDVNLTIDKAAGEFKKNVELEIERSLETWRNSIFQLESLLDQLLREETMIGQVYLRF